MRLFDGVPITAIEYYLGKDKRWLFHIYTDETMTESKNIGGMSTNFMVKRRLSDPDASAILSIAGSISGVFDANPALNAQRIAVLVDDEATDTELQASAYFWELVSTDPGAEVVLASGTFIAKQAVHIA